MFRSWYLRRCVVLVAALACSGATDQGDAISGLNLSVATREGWVGERKAVVATRPDGAGGDQWFQGITWEVTDDAVARIDGSSDSTATVRFVGKGTGVVIARLGTLADSATFTVREEGELLGVTAWAGKASLNTPAVDDAGNIYLIRSDPGAVVSFTSGLAFRWEHELLLGGVSNPVISNGGLVIATSFGGLTIAFDAGGNVVWADSGFGTGEASPAVSRAGDLFQSGRGAETLGNWALKRFAADGSAIATFQSAPVRTSPLILGDSVLITVGSDRVAVGRSLTGDTIWTVLLPSSPRFFGPSIGSNGRDVYIPTDDRVVAVDGFSGNVLWNWLAPQFPTNVMSPVTGRDGKVFIQTSTTLVALGPDGSTAWRADTLGSGHFSGTGGGPAVAADGVLYANCNLDICSVNAADGSVRWRIPLPVSGRPGPISVLPDSSIVFVTINLADSSYVVRLRGRFPLERSSWPLDGGGPARRRRN